MLWINILSLYLLCITLLGIFWTVEIKTLNGSIHAHLLLFLCIAVSFYIFGYVMELNSFRKSQIQFWNTIEYIGIPYVSALWLTIAINYIGYSVRYKKILFSFIYIIPIITMMLRFTNDYHHLYFSSVSYVKVFGKLFFIKKYGVWMYLQMFHSMSMIVIAMGLFIRESVQNEERNIGQIMFTIIASVFAVGGLILSAVRPFRLPIDYMAMCLPVTSLCVMLAISKYELLDVKSIARNKAFESGDDAILLINAHNKVIDYNISAKQLFEQINVHLDDRYLTKILAHKPDFLTNIQNIEASAVTLVVDGKEQHYDILTKSIDDNKISRGWIKTIRNVTPIFQLTEELKNQAMIDELSTLYNRRAFLQIAQEWIEESYNKERNLNFIMIDFDYFKRVNDRYGHLAGDLVIREFGKMLKEHFSANSLIARLGGEEFAVLSSIAKDEEILHSVDDLLKNAEQHKYCYRDYEFHVTISMGVAKKQADQTLESLMRIADNALYQSKERGRNCYTVI